MSPLEQAILYKAGLSDNWTREYSFIILTQKRTSTLLNKLQAWNSVFSFYFASFDIPRGSTYAMCIFDVIILISFASVYVRLDVKGNSAFETLNRLDFARSQGFTLLGFQDQYWWSPVQEAVFRLTGSDNQNETPNQITCKAQFRYYHIDFPLICDDTQKIEIFVIEKKLLERRKINWPNHVLKYV